MHNSKRSLPFIFLFLLLLQGLQAQSIIDSLVWAKAIKSQGLETIQDVVSDDADNIYFMSTYHSCSDCFIAIDGDTLYQGGDDNPQVFLAKLDKDGNLLAHRIFSGESPTYRFSFEIDHNGHLVFFFLSEDVFYLPNYPFEIGFNLIKLDQNLDFMWSLNLKGLDLSTFPFAPKISTTASNDIIIGGHTRAYTNYDNVIDTIITSNNDTSYVYEQLYRSLEIGNDIFPLEKNNFFIAKISEQGDLIWAKTFENDGPITLASVHVNPDESISILGTMEEEDWIVGSDTLSIVGSPLALNPENLFVLKTDSQGNPLWAKRYCENLFRANNIASDNEGNLIIALTFDYSVIFDEYTLYATYGNILLFKTDPFGNMLWREVFGDLTINTHSNIIINDQNEIYLSGDLSPSTGMIMTKLSPSGETLWELDPPGYSEREGSDLTFDYSGNLIHTGAFNDDFSIGDYVLEDNNPNWEPFILKFRNQTASLPTSLDELLMPEYHKISISPVPSSGQLQLQVDDFTVQRLQLFNSSGQMIWQDQEGFSGIKTIDLSFLNSGFYFLQFKTKNGIVSKKIIIAK